MSYQRAMIDDIEISNTEIEEIIEDVDVTETVYLEEGRIKLSNDQIELEVGNLAGESLSISKLKRLTQLYANMFSSPSDVVPPVPTLYPVFESTKHMMQDDFKPPFYYKIDLELDPDNNIKGQMLENFLQAFDKLNRDRDVPYVHTSRAMWAHMRPYDFSSGKAVERATDAYWKTNGGLATRLVPQLRIDVGHRPDVIDAEYLKENTCPQGKKYIERPQFETTYDGDKTSIVGYVNYVKVGAPVVFDIKAYKEHLSGLEVGQKVVVMPNTVAIDYRGNFVYEVDGHVSENTGKSVKVALEKNITIEGFVIKQVEVSLERYTPFFVYGSKFEPKFSKPQMAYNNYSFPFVNTNYILPLSWSEHLMLFSHKATSYEKLIKMMGYKNTDLGILPVLKRFTRQKKHSTYVPTRNVYRHVPSDVFDFSSHNDLLKYYKHPYQFANTYVDSDTSRFAYLKSKPDFGMLYALGFAWKGPGREQVEKYLRQVKEKLSKLTVDAPTIRPPRVLKSYTSLVSLQNDNGRVLYADKHLDKTRYFLKDRTDLKGKELKAFLIKEYDTDEYEAESILEGRCKVQEGDMATLEFMGHKSTFRWANVGKEYMWVKTTQAPACGPELPSFEDLSKDKTMVIDSYDNLCKSSLKARQHHEYMTAINAITLLEAAMETYDSESLQEELAIHIKIAESVEELRKPNTNPMYGYVDKVAYEEYFGTEDAYNLDNMFMNFGFEDGPRVMNPLAARVEEPKSIVDIICSVLELSGMDDSTKKYISDRLELKHPDSEMHKQIEKLNSDILKLMQTYKGKGEKVLKEMKVKLDAAKSKKVEEIQKKHYYDKTSLCVSLIILVIMIKNPSIVIKKLMPGCVKTFSHIGYPMLPEESPRSLTKYMACVLKAISSPKDARFALFNDIEDNTKALVIKTKQVLIEDLQLKSLIESKKIEESEAPERDDVTYDVLNTFFRPCFDFAHISYTDPAIRLVKHIHGAIKSSKAMRFNIVNMPLIANTCCIELLEKKSNFYDFFRGDELSALQRVLLRDKTARVFVTLFMKTKARPSEDLFTKKTVPVSAVTVAKPMQRRVLEESPKEWDTVLEETKTMWDAIENMVGSLPTQARRLFINIEDLKEVARLRGVLFAYLRGSFASTVSKVANGFRFGKNQKFDKADPFVLLLEGAAGLPGLKHVSSAVGPFLGKIQGSTKIDVESSVHDIIKYSNAMCSFMVDVMWMISSGSVLPEIDLENRLSKLETMVKAPQGKIACDLVRLLITRMAEYVSTNYFDVSEIKKQVEILREKRKEEIMAKYSRDIEERNQQKILRNMGLELEAMPVVALPTGEGNSHVAMEEDAVPEADVPVVAAAEAEYGDYVVAHGENADDDVDHDGYD